MLSRILTLVTMTLDRQARQTLAVGRSVPESDEVTLTCMSTFADASLVTFARTLSGLALPQTDGAFQVADWRDRS